MAVVGVAYPVFLLYNAIDPGAVGKIFVIVNVFAAVLQLLLLTACTLIVPIVPAPAGTLA